MSKEAYFDMCRELGTEPIEAEIPIEASDFPIIVQQAFIIYEGLQDNWEGMSGRYLGKNLTGFKDIMDLYEIPQEERLLVLKTINTMDSIRAAEVLQKLKAAQASNKPAGK